MIEITECRNRVHAHIDGAQWDSARSFLLDELQSCRKGNLNRRGSLQDLLVLVEACAGRLDRAMHLARQSTSIPVRSPSHRVLAYLVLYARLVKKERRKDAQTVSRWMLDLAALFRCSEALEIIRAYVSIREGIPRRTAPILKRLLEREERRFGIRTDRQPTARLPIKDRILRAYKIYRDSAARFQDLVLKLGESTVEERRPLVQNYLEVERVTFFRKAARKLPVR